MQSILRRPAASLISTSRTCQIPRYSLRRGFTSQPALRSSHTDDSSRPVGPSSVSGGRKGMLFAIGGVVILVVAGRYILVSDKPFRSGQLERSEIRNQKDYDVSKEIRDPRDSGVKTLKQKAEKENGS